MVSETVYDLTHRQLSFAYDFAGEQKVKGQDHPIVGYRVRMPGSNAAPEPDATTTQNRPIRKADAAAFARSPARISPMGSRPTTAASTSCGIGSSAQPKQVRGPIAMIALFATINLLTSGFSTIWFIYPSIPFVLFLLFHFLVLTKRTYNRERLWELARKMAEKTALDGVRALVFDVFGTVVDWRGGVAREAAPFLARHGAGHVEPAAFADAMARPLSTGNGGNTQRRTAIYRLDVLHRENLEAMLPAFGIDPAGVPRAELDNLNLAWHRLDPWPDSVAGLMRLKARYIIAPLSNGTSS